MELPEAYNQKCGTRAVDVTQWAGLGKELEHVADNDILVDMEVEELVTKKESNATKEDRNLFSPLCSMDIAFAESEVDDADDNEENTFSQLSEEIVIKIFEYLPQLELGKCAAVCKNWRRLSYDSSLWKEVCSENTRFMRAGGLGHVLHRGVEILRIRNAKLLADICAKGCPFGRRQGRKKKTHDSCQKFNIKEIYATSAYFADGVLLTFIKKCKLLKSLFLEKCELNDAVIVALCNSHSLEELNIESCKDISDEALETFILCSSKRLKTLNISQTNLSSKVIAKIPQCSSLRKLNLSGLKDATNDQIVGEIVTECKLLSHLDLSDCTNLTSETFEVICQKGLNLRNLTISHSFRIPANMLKNLSALPHLSHLEVFGFSNAHALNNLQRLVPSLKINQRVFRSTTRPPPVICTNAGYGWEQRLAFCM